jgi:hypothetical protein
MQKGVRSLIFAALALSGISTAPAAIVVGLVLDPATTAGLSSDVSSIYSGPGTWHLFAVDDNADDFGISLYNVNVAGAASMRHTSPLANILDNDGNAIEAGFNVLRSPNASTAVHASQQLPGRSPVHITGIGQEAGNFADKIAALQPGGTILNSPTSSSWGNYSTISPLNGKNWLFLGEGTYDIGTLPSISKASFSVYDNPETFNSRFAPTLIVPDSITATLLTGDYLASLAPQPNPGTVSAPPVAPPPPPVEQPEPPAPPPQQPPTTPPPVVDPPPAKPFVPPPAGPWNPPDPPQTDPVPPPSDPNSLPVTYYVWHGHEFPTSTIIINWEERLGSLRERQAAMIAKLRELAVPTDADPTNVIVNPLFTTFFPPDDPSAYLIQNYGIAYDGAFATSAGFTDLAFSGTSASATITFSDSTATPEPSALALLIVAQGFCLVASRPRRTL